MPRLFSGVYGLGSRDFRPERDTELLRGHPTLEIINGLPRAEFLKKVGAAPPS